MENRACTQLFRDAVLAAGDHDLTRRYAVEHKVLTAAVKLAEHIVKQQHRILAVLIEEFPTEMRAHVGGVNCNHIQRLS